MSGLRVKSLLAPAVLVATFATAFAYVGPGTGLGAIGAFLACFVGLLVAILGFFWYPVKRLLGRGSQEPEDSHDLGDDSIEDEAER